MPYYHVPVTLVIQSDSAGYALDTAEAELRSLVQRWSQEIVTYIVPESAAAVQEEDGDDLDAPHILPEDFAV